MNFSEFCNMAQHKYFGYDAQYTYLKALFKAARIRRDYSEDYLKALFNGNKRFVPIKKQFPRPLDRDSIKCFFRNHIKNEYLETICDAFGIPADCEKDLQYLCSALTFQFCKFVESDAEDIENCVPDAYMKAKVQNETRDYFIQSVLYDGDDVWAEEQYKKHAVNCYEHFQHTWVIHNHGTTYWCKRKLVCKNLHEITPVLSDEVIQLPDVPPNGYIKIVTDIDARGCEGHFVSKWEMQDLSGSNCFPGSRNIFDITIDVLFEPNAMEG